ncbi:MAG: 5-methyltetrahydropteroyltriglutamate--homocysteine S-methyltransferase [Syntrophales bacterium]
MKTHILGFPRIGTRRELKKALEDYWSGAISSQQLLSVSDSLKEANWKIQSDSGLSYVTTGDFSLYDHVLDMTATLGAIPERFGALSPENFLEIYFRMARGDAANNIAALEMTKWFNTNYHYIVPEISPDMMFSLSGRSVLEDTQRAVTLGYRPKPTLIGPVTYLSLAKPVEGADLWEKLDEITDIYARLIAALSALCDWIQLDEPILCCNMTARARSAFPKTYEKLNSAAAEGGILLATYFDAVDDNLDLALSSGCSGLHVDLSGSGKRNLDTLLNRLPGSMTLSAGVVDGRNVWKTELKAALALLEKIGNRIGLDRMMIGSSCSLLHCPVDLSQEMKLDAEIKNWMSFAVQKCEEVGLLGDVLSGKLRGEDLHANEAAVRSRRESPLTLDDQVRNRCRNVQEDMLHRESPYAERRKAQSWLDLPLLPTTTIGSFPQTPEIRKNRLLYKKGELSREAYESFLKDEIGKIVDIQEDLGLDVLVHGEPERNDMVEYFGEQLNGFCITENGWVQSYGSRCVKPPVIYGDVSRSSPMTVAWFLYAQSLTRKAMKGMLTGPVTILCWSFVRDDLDRADVCRQIALALRDEVMDLEKAGAHIIQIDEPALREGLPLKRGDAAAYLRWAVDAFRLASSSVADSTQIHTHMCYSEFNAIIESVAEMDADVISIESSRSRMELLDAFEIFQYPNEIGPGVYDIHSPRVPSIEEIVILLQKALGRIDAEQLWVNPDCGLKTRSWTETLQSLDNMVTATRIMRKSIKGQQAWSG